MVRGEVHGNGCEKPNQRAPQVCVGGINRAAKANRDESEQRKWADGRDQRRRKQ